MAWGVKPLNRLEIVYNSVEFVKYRGDHHYHITIPALLRYDSYANKDIDFMIDTGAFLTLVTRQTAIVHGFNNLDVIFEWELRSFNNKMVAIADFVELPGLVIGGKMLIGAKVGIPKENTRLNILGMNILEHFKFYLDTEDEKLYFEDNRKYKLDTALACKEIVTVEGGARMG